MARESSTSASSERTARYVQAAVTSEIANVRYATSGRGPAAFKSAAILGGFVGAGLLDAVTTEEMLVAAAASTGLSDREARGHIRRGLKRGALSPREIPAIGSVERVGRMPPPRTTSNAAEPPYLREAEVAALWNAAQSVSGDPEAAAWLHSRYRDHVTGVTTLVELWDLARVLPKNAPIPAWAGTGAGPWNRTGHRLLFRLWNARGRFVSMRARSLSSSATLKALAPTGFSVAGLVLADPLAVQLLAGDPLSWWTEPTIVVSEGEPDWLAWAARHGDARAQGPAYIGVVAGSWSQQIAARIPDNTRVIVRTDHDAPGERYANDIIMGLRGRCPVLRSRSQGVEE